ncbi:stage III sporulation protein SpoIIIAB [Clostridium aestuarii]|uniref:Stage III sporulation protein SpoIIIAB n=1 Tax=Clostridium aestuarii TaxID=338193 RepID=A0ABT4CXP6_9CLOT|nr:stage III sporulation protein SpoIIIAB [Clostridium aestuarii]
MYLKFIGCILIIFGSTLIGFIYGENLKKRVQQLQELERVIYQLQNEIMYTHTPLPEIFIHAGEKCDKPIGEIFLEVSKLLLKNEVDNVYCAFNQVLKCNKSLLDLKDDDIKIILNLAKALGETDIDGHKNIISLTLLNLKKQIKNAEEIMNKNVKMYRYLGFSFGAILAIMIV